MWNTNLEGMKAGGRGKDLLETAHRKRAYGMNEASHRGAETNPPNRFLAMRRETDPLIEEAAFEPPEPASPRTEFISDHSQSALTSNDSPDIGFAWSVNPYRGCEHGCAYCYARPTHEYLGYGAGVDFESKILVKHDAPELLRRELGRPGWTPQPIALSGVTDCYQPVEARLKLTRRCLEVLAEFRNPVTIVTKNALVARDIDLLAELARHRAVAVTISITTLDPELRAVLEPRASVPSARLAAVRKLAAAGVPTGVLVAPVIPAINDHEIPRVIEAAAAAGASHASYVLLRLPLTVRPVFEEWLGRHFPDRQEKVLNQVRAFRDGALNTAEFGERMRGRGPAADRLRQMFEVACRRHGLARGFPGLNAAAFRRVERGQPELF
jgi:DNA repair photolyase